MKDETTASNRGQTRFGNLGRVAIVLLITGFIWAPWASVAEEPNPQPDSEAPAKPGPDNRKEGQEPGLGAPESAATSTSTSICLLLRSAAQAHGLPLEFFARLIWQESRFQPNAVGPMTRSGRRAQGIGQFMPETASERGLFDPFDPVAALPKSAEFLEELHAQFGNLGLAAAAYNAGPRRVREWIARRGSLPAETRNYVLAITGRTADEWASANSDHHALAPSKHTSCAELVALLKEQPSAFVGELERRVREGAAQPWGVQLSADSSVTERWPRMRHSRRSIGRFCKIGIRLSSRASSAAAARTHSIRCVSGPTRGQEPTNSAPPYINPAALVWCCAIPWENLAGCSLSRPMQELRFHLSGFGEIERCPR